MQGEKTKAWEDMSYLFTSVVRVTVVKVQIQPLLNHYRREKNLLWNKRAEKLGRQKQHMSTAPATKGFCGP